MRFNQVRKLGLLDFWLHVETKVVKFQYSDVFKWAHSSEEASFDHMCSIRFEPCALWGTYSMCDLFNHRLAQARTNEVLNRLYQLLELSSRALLNWRTRKAPVLDVRPFIFVSWLNATNAKHVCSCWDTVLLLAGFLGRNIERFSNKIGKLRTFSLLKPLSEKQQRVRKCTMKNTALRVTRKIMTIEKMITFTDF